jgi:hypothetical protein
MRWLLFGGALVLGLLVWTIVRRGALYRRLFADEHFLEIGGRIAELKRGALGLADSAEPPPSPTDPRVLLTQAGLAVVYTVRRDEKHWVHHASVSLAGGYTAHSLGEAFILFLAGRLGVSLDRLALSVTPSTVHHAEWTLDDAEHAAFAAQPVEASSVEDLAAFRRKWATVREGLRWERSVPSA